MRKTVLLLASLAVATGGVVTRYHVSNLRKGKIENPHFEKLRAIAKAMNFSLNVRHVERGG